jgi:uncharacterized protein YegP (UPF0339 family)
MAASHGLFPSRQQARMDTLRVRLAAATARVETFRDGSGRFGWRLLSRSGSVLAVSAVAYVTRTAAEVAVARFRREASHAELDEG